jgi:hypothetical protein
VNSGCTCRAIYPLSPSNSDADGTEIDLTNYIPVKGTIAKT